MNLDESFLSAYLDDEIDPDGRRAVDDAIASVPGVDDRLARLAANRDLVSGLTRPSAPCSLISSVMTRIDQSQSVRRRRPYYWIATAASILFALILLQSVHSEKVAPRDRADLALAVNVPAKSVALKSEQSIPEVSDARQASPREIAPVPVGEPADLGQRRMVSMLDRPGTSRILIVTDVLDPAARDRVNAILRETPRKYPDFGRFTVVQGIVVDPAHPNEAEVFPTVMDERERGIFLAKVSQEFATVIDESVTDPSIGVQLADVGAIRIESSPTAAGLGDPPTDAVFITAIRSHSPPDLDVPSDLGDPTSIPKAVRTGPGVDSPLASRPLAAQTGGQSELKPPRKAPMPVLVWVTSHQPARPMD